MKALFLCLCLASSLAFARNGSSRAAQLKARDFRVHTTSLPRGIRVASNREVAAASSPAVRASLRPHKYDQPDSRLGLMLGMNFAYGLATPTQSGATRNSLGVAGFWQRRLSDSFSFQPELHYAPRGVRTNVFSFSSMDVSGDVSLDYLEVPLLFRYNAVEATTSSPGFFVMAGPSAAIALSRAVEVMGVVELDLASRFSQFDFLFHFGVGLEYPLSRSVNLVSNLRYALGFVDIDKTENSYFTRHIQLSAGMSWSW